MAAFLGALALCTCAVAQGGGWAAVRGIPPGSRVKVQLLRAKGVKGMLVEASASGMEVQTANGSTRPLDRRQIAKVYLIGKARKLRDGLIGAGTASVGGVALVLAAYNPQDGESCLSPCVPARPWSTAAVAALYGAAIGAIGAVIGAVIGSHHAKTL
ncbi:MAG: hypothetical protein ACRD13_10235, partial [Terriglobales bacterium]